MHKLHNHSVQRIWEYMEENSEEYDDRSVSSLGSLTVGSGAGNKTAEVHRRGHLKEVVVSWQGRRKG